jgi:NAD(P)-dependent dehydrogenase (short-subunit alcohol dehydrogenase family)
MTRDDKPSNPAKDYAELIAEASEFLEAVSEEYERLGTLPQKVRQRFLMAAGRVARPGPWERHALASAALERRKSEIRKKDEGILARTGIRTSRRQPVFTPWSHGGTIDEHGRVHTHDVAEEAPPESSRLEESVPCYVCKNPFRDVHFFYDALCPSCAELNWKKRTPHADLTGRAAVITGARVKIGFHAALMLLRAGARVVVTTRFPRDAATRYAAEQDFADWSDRLEVFGLDLRHTPSVERFSRFLQGHLERLDFLVNNACQTVRRPAGFYRHLMEGEARPFAQLGGDARALLGAYEGMRDAGVQGALPSSDTAGIHQSAALSQITLLEEDLQRKTPLFPAGQLDADLQQVDLREVNSWRLGLGDVSAVELLEVQLVNAIAPFILNARLKPLMLRVDTRDKHIVNVSAVEGQFSRRQKTHRHPHTNMAKAALNMMTRTSAADYLRDGIHMNSVDTGWITDEDPAAIAERKKREQGFHPPLDIVDGAARIVDPIFTGMATGTHTWGAFLKDYRVVDW